MACAVVVPGAVVSISTLAVCLPEMHDAAEVPTGPAAHRYTVAPLFDAQNDNTKALPHTLHHLCDSKSQIVPN